MVQKDKIKTDFIEKFSKLQLDISSLSSVFIYMQDLNSLLDSVYDAGYNEGFKNCASIDIKNNP